MNQNNVVDWKNAFFDRLKLTTDQTVVRGKFTIQRLHSHRYDDGERSNYCYFVDHPVFVGEDGRFIAYHAVMEFALWEPQHE